MRNSDPSMPFNRPERNYPDEPWNRPEYRNDPSAPWNDPGAGMDQLREYEESHNLPVEP